MARFTFKLPDIGEGIAEAEIVAWHVQVGDEVAEDTPLADLMTDKATVEMESPVAGKVVEIGGAEGDVLAIGSALVVLEVAGEVPETEKATPTAPVTPGEPEPTSQTVRPELVEGVSLSSRTPPEEKSRASTSSARTDSVGSADSSNKVLASPAVRKRAKDLGINIADVRPQAGGRIRHCDLDAYIAYTEGFDTAAPRPDETIKVIGLRKRIAENMAASKRHIPHFTYVEECDVTALEAMRADLNANRGERPRLTMLPLLITAMCRTLPDFPMINARYDDEANIITRHGAVHLGLATMTDNGLMVPVIRDAQGLNLWQLAREISRLAEAARSGKAKAHELSGSTITISSLGPLGGIASTPLINKPEVAILAPNRIVERPAFVPDGMGGERIEKRKCMNLSISCDHRVVDGYDAAAFVQELKHKLEAPALILAN